MPTLSTTTCTAPSMRWPTNSIAMCSSTRRRWSITTTMRAGQRATSAGLHHSHEQRMRLIVVSGLSGSRRSVALHMLEDLDWYCVDNIPAALIKAFVSLTLRTADSRYDRVAVGLDARNTPEEIATVPALLEELRSSGLGCDLLFVTASEEALLRRYAETRRKHPLSRDGESLREAI